MTRPRRWAALAGATIAISTLAACGGSDGSGGSGAPASSQSLTVGFVVDPSWAQVPVAAANGYFKQEGVDVKVVNFSTGVQALQALAAGQVDVTTAADVPVAAALANARNMRIIADGSRWRGSVIVASAKKGIRSAGDLAGKSVGTPLGTSAAYFASSFLRKAGASAHLLQVDPSAVVTSMQRGSVDAVSIFQPYQQQVIAALGRDAKVLKPAAGTYVQQSLYLASAKAVNGKAAALRAFEAALAKAGGDLQGQTAGAVSAVATATQLPPTLVKKVLPEFDYRLTLPASLPDQLASLGRWAKTAGNLPRGAALPDYATDVQRSFLPGSR